MGDPKAITLLGLHPGTVDGHSGEDPRSKGPPSHFLLYEKGNSPQARLWAQVDTTDLMNRMAIDSQDSVVLAEHYRTLVIGKMLASYLNQHSLSITLEESFSRSQRDLERSELHGTDGESPWRGNPCALLGGAYEITAPLQKSQIVCSLPSEKTHLPRGTYQM